MLKAITAILIGALIAALGVTSFIFCWLHVTAIAYHYAGLECWSVLWAIGSLLVIVYGASVICTAGYAIGNLNSARDKGYEGRTKFKYLFTWEESVIVIMRPAAKECR